jgi:hypothetical protein
MAHFLNDVRTRRSYRNLYSTSRKAFEKFGAPGRALYRGIRVGGVGTRVRQVLREAGIDTAVDELGVPDEFIAHATREQILQDAGLTAAKIAQDVVAQVLGKRVPMARQTGEAGAIELPIHESR